MKRAKNFVKIDADIFIIALRKSELLNALARNVSIYLRPPPRGQPALEPEFPFDENYVTDVWFNTVINYISFGGHEATEGSGLPDFSRLLGRRQPPGPHH